MISYKNESGHPFLGGFFLRDPFKKIAIGKPTAHSSNLNKGSANDRHHMPIPIHKNFTWLFFVPAASLLCFLLLRNKPL